MGIRFYCPNGHKLNVKSFQAGERGICPHCGARFTIPNESTRPSSKELEKNNPPTLDQLPSPGVATPGSDCEPSAVADPLAEDSEAVWYVRPPDGDQFGPASADVMRGWIDEGRVTGKSLVWREGWRDWVKAAAVLPQLGAGRPPGPTEIVVDPHPTTWNRPQRRSHNTTAIVITVLILLIIILSIVFFWVLSGSPDGATAFLGEWT